MNNTNESTYYDCYGDCNAKTSYVNKNIVYTSRITSNEALQKASQYLNYMSIEDLTKLLQIINTVINNKKFSIICSTNTNYN